jgi:dTDP-4-dehydrorhamnose reductase
LPSDRRILLLGATGFLGSHFAERLPQTMTVSLPRVRVEATDDRGVAAAIDEMRPDVIVNAIAVTSGAGEAMRAVNSEFPRRLAAQAEARGARVVHISTDGVFSGARGGYTERDAPDPQDAYGRSKADGELPAPHLTIRTSFFGRNPRGAGLVEWLLSQPGHFVEGFVDYRFTGIAAALVADLVAAAIDARLEGLYHLGGERVSKYDVVRALAAALRPDLRVVPVARGVPGRVDRTLDSSRFFSAVNRLPPTLADSVTAIARRVQTGSVLPTTGRRARSAGHDNGVAR